MLPQTSMHYSGGVNNRALGATVSLQTGAGIFLECFAHAIELLCVIRQ